MIRCNQYLFNFFIRKYIGFEITVFFWEGFRRNSVCRIAFANYKIKKPIDCADISQDSIGLHIPSVSNMT